MIDEVTSGADSLRQRELAIEIAQEFRQLKSYAESLTKLLNEEESPSKPTGEVGLYED